MIRVQKVADIVDNCIVFSIKQRVNSGTVAAILTNQQPCKDPIDAAAWSIILWIGEGEAARSVNIELPSMLSVNDPLDQPKFFVTDAYGWIPVPMIVYFRDRLFMPERLPCNATEQEEITLRVKKATYEEDTDISCLRAAVSNLEAAMEFRKSGPKREAIPEDVKLIAWARDGGSCVRCGSKQSLHFDHIIPVAKGGGNSAANIQILCQPCNLAKSDRIAV